MHSDNSAAYYFKREQQALALANGAADAYIRDIHLEMAERYGRMASERTSHIEAREKLATGCPPAQAARRSRR